MDEKTTRELASHIHCGMRLEAVFVPSILYRHRPWLKQNSRYLISQCKRFEVAVEVMDERLRVIFGMLL